MLLECRCEASREAALIAAEIYDEAIAVPYQTALTVFARRQSPVEGRMQLFCTTADRPAGRSLEKRDDYVRVATLNEVEVRPITQHVVYSMARIQYKLCLLVHQMFVGHVIYMTCAPIVLAVVTIRGINSKDEQGNDSITVTRRSRQRHSN